MPNFSQLFSLFCLSIFFSCQNEPPTDPPIVLKMDAERAAQLAKNIKTASPATTIEGVEFELFASDSLVSDPIAISVDPQGRIFYTKANRQTNSEFDMRGQWHWMPASLSFETVEDRRKFLRENFSPDSEESKRALKDLNKDGVLDWQDLTVEKEQVWFVADESGDGVADIAQLYLEDFHEEITDVANGLEYANGEVFIGVGPDLWRTIDQDGNGVADKIESISHGYAVHVGFSGHGMSGVTLGPDGRIWWGIGDIGMNVTDKEGNHWKYPNQGVIVRSEPDGSNFEVYCAGVRNTHEFVFDEYGNLISEDNDGDHPGEGERLVYLINGSDSGWRHNWQFGKYTDPANNTYKVWVDEKLHVPHWEGQAAYILPPITNYVNGPTGMVYNPGTALGERWYKHFFISEFRGSPANSPVHAFTLKQDGAGFQLDQTQEFFSGILPTGLDWGPEGALYCGDWIDGWAPKKEGRIWRVDVPGGADTPIRQQTKALIQADFSKKTKNDLGALLSHQDMRVRIKAQHELAKRGTESLDLFLAIAKNEASQLARIHALWGIGQLSRKDISHAQHFAEFLADGDVEIVTQTAKIIGDVRYAESGDLLIPLIRSANPRLQLHVVEALGRIGHQPAFDAIVNFIDRNNDQDIWLRHAGQIALSRLNMAAELIGLQNHSSTSVRIAATIALRRMGHGGIAAFLNDPEESVATEAARGINDDFSILEAMPALANSLISTSFKGEAYIRRAINANLRVGKQENIGNLVDYIQSSNAVADMRAEAIATLSTWAKPSIYDRVDGRYRGELTRDATPVKEAFEPLAKKLLASREEAVQAATTSAVAKLKLAGLEEDLFSLVTIARSTEVRSAALRALYDLESEKLSVALENAMTDKSKEVRSTALAIIPDSDLPEQDAVSLFEQIIKKGTMVEKQVALTSLGSLKGEKSITALDKVFEQLKAGHLESTIHLDVIDAIAKQGDATLLAKLQAYQDNKPKDDPLSLFRETLAGGNASGGEHLFYNHQSAQCVRCHTIFEFGGDAGPGLEGVGDRLSREELLAALVLPSAAFAKGYGVVALTLKNGDEIAGIIKEENETSLQLKIGLVEIREIQKTEIVERDNIPSAMPPMGNILTKKEIRDLVAFLEGLKEKE